MFNKQFGNTSFGTNTFGTTAAFGQNAAANSFGQKPAATNAFGTASSFGATPSNNLFGASQTPAPTANAFGQGFGQPTQSAPQLGTGLFGTPNQTATASTPNVFGGTGTAFGARPQYGFASSGSSLFGNQAQASTSNNLFSQPLTTNNSLFNSGFSATTNTTGTPIKFTASIGSDSMIKNGATISINTRHHVINFMKEYENKSFEELRMEDYLANRKGPNASTLGSTAPAQNLFSSPQQNTSGFAFTQPAQKPMFGGTTTNTAFGAPNPGLFGAANQTQGAAATSFNKPVGFGAPAASTNTFGFGSTNSAFNTTLQPKFGATTPASVPSFGATNAFGTTPAFGATANPFAQKPTAFGSPLTTTTTAASAFNFTNPAQSSTNLFGAKPAGSAFATPALGSNTSTFTGFGASQATSNLFGPKPNTFGTSFGNSFGATNAFGTTVTSTPSMFNTTVNKPTAFSFNTPSAFNINPSQNSFNLNPINTTATLGGISNSQLACQNQMQQQLAVLNFSPFGDSPLFRNVIKSSNQTTDPNVQKNFRDLNSYDKIPHLKPSNTLIKIKPIPVKSKPLLFDGIKEEESLNYSQPFTPRISSKRLVLNSSLNKSSNINNDSSLHMDTPPLSRNKPQNLDNSVTEDSPETNLIKSKDDFSILSANKNNESLNDTIKDLNIKSSNKERSPGATSNNSSLYASFIAPDDTDPLPQPAPAHPSGIKLTRYGYYTVPSLDQLTELMDEDGNCFVTGFAIGRENYGNVVFSDRLNVANLNLDDIVFFRRKEITLYPDEDNKPPFGQELNRKAQVTLDCVWPIDKSTHEAIKDPERLKTLRYAEKLEQATSRIGAKFIEYRPETGSWVFSVKHFSKYGLLDDSDEEGGIDPNLALPKMQILPPPPVASVSELNESQLLQPPQPQQQQEESMILDERVDDSAEDLFYSEDDPIINSSFLSSSNLDFSYELSQLNTTSQRVGMKLLFEDDEEMENTLDISEPASKYFSKNKHFQTSFFKEAFKSPAETSFSQHEVIPPPKFSIQPMLNVPSIKKPSIRALRFSILKNKSHLLKDAGSFMSYSFRVGHGPNMKTSQISSREQRENLGLVSGSPFGGSYRAPKECQYNFSAIGYKTIPAYSLIHDPLDDPQKEFLQIFLKEQLKHSQLSSENDSNNTPRFVPTSGSDCLESLTLLSADYQASLNSEHFDYDFSSQQKMVFDLVKVLWGPFDGGVKEDSLYAKNMARRERLSDWLANVTQSKLQADRMKTGRFAMSGPSLVNVFSLLTCHQIEKAVELAIEQGDLRLSMLIAQAGSTEEVKALIKSQLQIWLDQKVDMYVDEQKLLTYILLSGMLIWYCNQGEINCCNGLDWKRAFALHFWYKCQANCSIKEALESYEDAFKGIDSYAISPFPPYVENSIERISELNYLDTNYHLLKLFVDPRHNASQLLSPSNYGSSQLDFRLSWFLQRALTAVGLSFPENLLDRLHSEFASQLSVLGLWQWSIFALQHLHDPVMRDAAIVDVLNRNVCLKEVNETEKFLLEQLHLPKNLLFRAKALKAKHLFEPYLEAKYLLKAQVYWEAHEVIIKSLISKLVINERFEEMKSLLAPFNDEAISNTIPDWNNRGKIFMDYLELCDIMSQKERDLVALSFRDYSPKIIDLTVKISALEYSKPIERVCQTFMIKKAFSFLQLMFQYQSQLNPISEDSHSSILNLLIQAPLPEDVRVEELQLLMSNYMTQTAC